MQSVFWVHSSIVYDTQALVVIEIAIILAISTKRSKKCPCVAGIDETAEIILLSQPYHALESLQFDSEFRNVPQKPNNDRKAERRAQSGFEG
ncbi:hypothetical protein [Methylomonas fluvii]|uniref:hypothetical protein n=1 Tax=Methylomonas fluvii TaxID=1854564 RepID=UPI0018A7D7BB|nr:hypothetical protein [Methylomonas fluvii]